MLTLRSHHTSSEVFDDSRKRKADNPSDCRHRKVHVSETIPGEESRDVEGDRQAKLEEYCNWGLTQVESDRWRNALHIANQIAMDQFLKLNTILQHPKVVACQIKYPCSPLWYQRPSRPR